jgi:hypothetical protein
MYLQKNHAIAALPITMFPPGSSAGVAAAQFGPVLSGKR